MITVQNLVHSYDGGHTLAVDHISFEIAKAEIFGFLGPNGAGKSTTQKVLTGVLPLQGGRVTVEGIDVRRPGREFFNMIGVCFEQPNFYRKFTGLENLNFFRGMYDVPTRDPRELLRLVGLGGAMNKKAGDYSKGMQQKLMLARSLVNNPRIWFLDEPTSGLDPESARNVKEIILAEKSRGTTIFLTTHNMFDAEELCDRVAFLNSGRIVAVDTPRNLKLQYGERMVRVEYRQDGQLVTARLSLADDKEKKRLHELLDSGCVETLHSQEATLDEIFIKLTGKGLS
ncbi:MAG: ABC transporter ATP-binding protein [Peptococcaceae bacterium]|nr:ABC transporter ATP-binding protein [Peptococcaceae bacterium]